MTHHDWRTPVRGLLHETLAGGLPTDWDDDGPLVEVGLDSVAVLNLGSRDYIEWLAQNLA